MLAKSFDNIEISELAIDTVSDILCWKLPKPDLSESVCVYIGDENQTFFNLTVSLKGIFRIKSLKLAGVASIF